MIRPPSSLTCPAFYSMRFINTTFIMVGLALMAATIDSVAGSPGDVEARQVPACVGRDCTTVACGSACQCVSVTLTGLPTVAVSYLAHRAEEGD